jgi:phage protein D
VLYNLIGLGNVEFGNVRADLNAANAAITSLSANITAANAAIITANTGMKSYVDATILSNVAYTMANYQNWTSNVSSIGTALDQLAERLKAAGY